MWPTEAFEDWLRIISYLSPVTYPADGMRSILLKGLCVAVL